MASRAPEADARLDASLEPAAARAENASAGAGIASTEGPPQEFPPLKVVAGFALMAIGMFMAVLDIQIVAASLGQIQAGLAASETEVSWVQTSYLVAEVIMIPLSGFLMRALGGRNLFVLSAASFTVTSALCATATTLGEMIVYRSLQGFLGGAMIPTAFAASFSFFPQRYKTQVTVAVALLITLAPTVGPTLGGLLTDAFSWHWIFLVNIVPGVIITAGVLAFVDWGKPDYALLKRIDLLGLLLMALFLGGLDYVLEEGARENWFEDPTITTVAVMVGFSGVLFIWRNLASSEPIVDLTVMQNRNFAFACLLQLALGLALFGLTYAYPVFLGRIGGLSSAQIGETVAITGATMFLAAPLAGRIARKTDPRLVCSAGFLFLALSAWTSHGITADWRFHELLWPQIFRGLGLICLIVSTTTIAFATLPHEKTPAGSPLFILMRNVGGALGLAFINTLLIERGYFHWERLVEAMGTEAGLVGERMDMLRQMAETWGLDQDTAPLRIIAREVMREATVISFGEIFQLLAVLFVGMAAIPMLVRRPPTFEQVPEAH